MNLKKGQFVKDSKTGNTYRFIGNDGDPPTKANLVLHAEADFQMAQPKYEAPGALASVGRGVEDILGGAEQIGRRMFGDDQATADWEAKKNAELAMYEQGQGGGFDPGRLASNVLAGAPLALVPGGAAGLLGRVATGAGIGAVEGATAYSDTSQGGFGTQKAVQGLLGAGGGAIGGAVAPSVARALQRLPAAAKAVVRRLLPDQQQKLIVALQTAAEASGMRWDDLSTAVQADVTRKAAEQMSVTGRIDAEALIRRARFQQLGYEGQTGPMRAQVTADPQDWSELQDLISHPEGRAAQLRYMAQNQRHHEVARRLSEGARQGEVGAQSLSGAPPGDRPPITTSEVPYALRGTARAMERGSQAQVARAYRSAKQSPGLDQMTPNFQRFQGRITEVFNEFPAGVRDQLPRRVLQLVDGEIAPSVDNIIDAFQTVNRTARNVQDPQLGAFYGRIARTLHSALDDAANEGGAAAARLLAANRLAAKRFGVIRGTGRDTYKLVDSILKGDRIDNLITTKIISGDPDEIFGLRRFLLEFPEDFQRIPREQARQAWNNIRASVIEELAKKGNLGDERFNRFDGRRFQKAWDNLGRVRQRALFSEEEINFIEQVTLAIRDMTSTPAGPTTHSTSRSSAWLARALSQARAAPGVIGTFARTLTASVEDVAAANASRQLSRKAMSGDPISAQALEAYLRGSPAVTRAAADGGAAAASEQYK